MIECAKTTIKDLFPDVIVTAECNPQFTHDGMILPEEEVFVRRSVLKRRQDYIAGRIAARKALDYLGCPKTPLLVGANRVPLWPLGYIGSISHTDNFCGAAVGYTNVVKSIGFDAECIQIIDPDCWPQLFTSEELEWIYSRPTQQWNTHATLIFSAKECFYKCQYMLSKKWVDFHDVTITINLHDKSFLARLSIDICETLPLGTQLYGKYKFNQHRVFTGITLEA